MFVDVHLRRRARLDEPMEALNARLVEQMAGLAGFWGEGKTAADAPFGQDEVGSLDLREALRDGLAGQIVYRARFAGYLSKDAATADNTMHLRLDASKIDYGAFCAKTLPRLIAIFGSYRGYMETDAKVDAADWEIVRAIGRDINGRHQGSESGLMG